MNTYFKEQFEVVNELYNNFKNPLIVNQLILGKTQSGKTNIIKCFIEYMEQIGNLNYHIDNRYIITGYSSIDWLKQTKERFNDLNETKMNCKHIFHQNQLNRNVINHFNHKSNYIVFIDENHIACRQLNNKTRIQKYKNNKESLQVSNIDIDTPNNNIKITNQTITKLFVECKWNDIDYCIRNNIKIIQISATPDGTLYDYEEWGEHSKIVFYEPPENYIGSYKLYEIGRIRQYKNLYEENCEIQNEYINEIFNSIKAFSKPKYHIIRLKTGDKFDQLYNLFSNKIDEYSEYIHIKLCSYLMTNSKKNVEVDINKLFLEQEPNFHIILFIKEKLRCAKTICKKYIGLCYERISNMDSVIIQGLVGRLNGFYHSNINIDDLPICYTNIDSILRYEELWRSRWTKTDIEWNSNSTKFMYNNTMSRGTYSQNPINVLNPIVKENTIIKSVHKSEIIQFKEFNNFEEAKKYIKNVLNKTSPHNPFNKKQNINENGFIETIVYKKRVYSVEDIKCMDTKAIMNKKNGFRLYPCYYDINNKDTLIFLVCHF